MVAMTDYAYQQRGVEFMRAHPRSINMDEMGLGKTRQALLAAEGRTLVIAPGMIRDMGVWETERQKWASNLDLTVASYHELPYKSAVLVEKENGRKAARFRMTDDLAPVFKTHWDTVIFDEAHHLKGRANHWTKASFQLRFDRLMLLTGTPIPNWAFELFTLLQHLRPGDAKRGGPLGSYYRWLKQWFTIDTLKNRNGDVISEFHTDGTLRACTPECATMRPKDSCEHWEAFRRFEFQDLWIRRRRDDVLTELPPLTGADELYRVPMTPNQAKAYRQLKKEMLTVLDSGESIIAWSKAGQLTRLRQLSTGLDCVSESKGSGKLDVLTEILENRSSPTLVVANYHTTLDAIARRLESMGLRYRELSGRTPSINYRKNTGEDFQAGKLDVLLGQVDTIAEGLTLTAADTVVIVEHSWRPSRNEQVIRRIHRIGQERPCTVVRLVTAKTVDEHMQELLREKTEHQIKALPARDWKGIL